MARKKAVVVEDDKDMCKVIERVVAKYYDTYCAHDGAPGIELIMRVKPHIIFLDIHLPGLSGNEVLRTIRANGIDAMVWVLSGDSNLDVITTSINLGAIGYATKPFQLAAIDHVAEWADKILPRK